jgi:uncharacterized protein YbjT (DUF2867 family)
VVIFRKKKLMRALLLGGTGLVGNEICKLLINDPDFEEIHLILRKEPDFNHPKLTIHQMNLEELMSLPDIKADVLFVAFGTTLAIAGSKECQEFIDVEIPTKVMRLAFQQGTRKCALVSAVGVSLKSPFFYSRMKAKLDQNAIETGFEHLVLAKPSVLDGDRKDNRIGEKLSIVIGNFIGMSGLINAYRPVKASNVAAAMIQKIKEGEIGTEELTNSQIPLIAKKYF